ncbi:DUF3261 domain-containing protein [Enterobacteriaceae bacterium BIT-l23]|uniref:DUF3261 domain-containing protein n=1 Tax=Jejubacter sp. L23 TaxID=3092086 RepID=UPI00158558CB|nr:DUF3261 domain-containing protein [Enterobacteriaceae bacterium BIT-l23]
MKGVLRGALLALSLALSACSNHDDSQGRPEAWLKPGVEVTLPAPTQIVPFSAQQLLTAQVDGQTHSLVVVLEADGQRLRLAGLSPLGVRLFSLNYDERGVKTEQAIALPKLPPASQVLADIMLCYWPTAHWQPQLPTGWSLTDKANRRELRDADGVLVETIHYQLQGERRVPTAIDNHAFGYRLTIEQLEGKS